MTKRRFATNQPTLATSQEKKTDEKYATLSLLAASLINGKLKRNKLHFLAYLVYFFAES